VSQIGRAAPQSSHDAALRATAVVAVALLALLIASALAYRPPLERPLSPIQFPPTDVQATPALTAAPFAPSQTSAPNNGVSDPALQTAPAIQTAAPALPSAKTPVEVPNQSFLPGFQPGPKEPLKPSIPKQN
jgi:hypothetical protein